MSLVPNIGEEYQGSVVVSIKEEMKDMGEKIRNRKYVTLKNGLMLVEDILEDKIKFQDIEGDYKEMPYNEVKFPDKSVMSPYDPNAKKEKKIKKIKSPKPLNLDDDEEEVEEVQDKDHHHADQAEKERLRKEEEEEQAKQARLEEARQLKLQAEQKKKEEAEAKEEEARQLKLQLEQKRKEAEEEAAKIKALEEEEALLMKKYQPQPIVAYSSLDTDAPDHGSGARAIWQVIDEDGQPQPNQQEVYPDQDCWQPQDLLLYAPGKEPPPPAQPASTTDDDDDKKAPSPPLAQGVWGYYPGSLPSDDDDEDDDNNFNSHLPDGWRPTSDVLVYPPGVTPPTNVKTDGIYTYAPPKHSIHNDDGDDDVGLWPPPIDKIKKMKKGLPNDFKNLQPLPVTVESASVPAASSSKAPPLNADETEVIDAVWAYPKGEERMDDKYWKSQPLWLYPPGLNKDDLPSSSSSPPIPEESSTTTTNSSPQPHEQPRRVQGIWGFAPGCEPDPDTGEWDKKNVLIYPPGTKPDDDDDGKDFKSQGTWEYRTPETDDDGDNATNTTAAMPFPPPYREPKDGDWEPQIATVYPTSKCPTEYDENEWKPQGIWKYYDNPLKDKKWRPQELLIYTDGQEPKTLLEDSNNNDNPYGVWGLSPDAIPDKSGNWSPQDMWFYPPNEVPPSKDNYWKPQGLWTYPPQKLNVEERWPPPAVRNIDEIGYKPKEVGDNDWTKPTRCYVGQMKAIFETMNVDKNDKVEVMHPKGKSPLGVWKKSTRNDDDDDGKISGNNDAPSWMSKTIVMYPPGEKPPTTNDDKNKNRRTGEWGLSPDAVPNDNTGEWDPSDIWFIGPDEIPPEEWVPGGIWTEVDEPKFRPKGADTDGDNWKPQTVAVVNSSKPSETAVGVWKFGTGDDDDDADDDWRPSQVCMYPPGDEPEDDDNDDDAGVKARGVWGLAPDAEPDDDGEWNPSDVWFVGPNETQPNDDEWIKQGIWTSDETEPKSPTPQKPQFIPKGESSATDWKPQNVSVGGGSKKSDDSDTSTGPPVGVWKFGRGGIDDDDDDDEWRPSQVCIHPPGHEPDDMDDDVKAQGAWGLAPNAEADEDGQYKPSDVWFFGVGETPPDNDEWIPHGVWTTKEEKPKKKKKKKTDTESPKKKSPKKKKADTSPKKKGSYLSKNWKEEQVQYGTITRTSYSCNYSDDNILSPAKVVKEKFELVSPTRRSQQKKLELKET